MRHEEDVIALLKLVNENIQFIRQPSNDENEVETLNDLIGSIQSCITNLMKLSSVHRHDRSGKLPKPASDGKISDASQLLDNIRFAWPNSRVTLGLAERLAKACTQQRFPCTFDGCEAPAFTDETEWFEHEMQQHRLLLRCPLCPNWQKGRKILANHLKQTHAENMPQEQLIILRCVLSTSLIHSCSIRRILLCLVAEINKYSDRLYLSLYFLQDD